MNYPNPFSHNTTINYKLREASNVQLTVVNSLGVEVGRLVDNEYQHKAEYNYYFDAGDLVPGVYFCRLKAGEEIRTVKLLMVE